MSFVSHLIRKLPESVTKAAPAATLGSWYAYAAAADPDQLPYDPSFWRAAATVSGTALSAWLSARRKVAALPVALATAALSAGMAIRHLARHDSYVTRTWKKGSWRETVFNGAMPVVHAIALPALVCAAGSASPTLAEGLLKRIPARLRPSWPALRRLGLYYMVFSLVGHWGEMLFCTGIKHGIIRGEYDRENHMLWDQWLFPFPAEGIATVLIALILYPAKNAILSHRQGLVSRGLISSGAAIGRTLLDTFFLNQLVCTSIDYLTGRVANQNYELWDYRDMPFNFQGQICLQNSLFYTVVATWAVWRLFPRMDGLLARASSSALDGTFVGLGAVYVFLELLYHVVPQKQD